MTASESTATVPSAQRRAVPGPDATGVTAARIARTVRSSRAIKVSASALTSDPYTPRDAVMPDFNAATQLAARSAYEQAGVGPDDLNLVELHDCFATAEIVHYEITGEEMPSERPKWDALRKGAEGAAG